MKNLLKVIATIGMLTVTSNIFADTVVDEVHFYHRKTSKAIRKCVKSKASDYRCNSGRRLYCGPCSRISHSDHSAYKVFKRTGGGGGGGGGYGQVNRSCQAYEQDEYSGRTVQTYSASANGRRGTGVKRRACNKALRRCERNKSYYNNCSARRGGFGGGGGYGGGERSLVNTFHFRHKKTSIAIQQCKTAKAQMPQCNRRGYLCTPCTQISHSDHSQYSLFRIR